MKYSELSKEFNKSWELTPEKLKKYETGFMGKVRSILWQLSQDPGDEGNITEAMDSSYDSTTILSDIKELIEEYNHVFHIVSMTSSWENDTIVEDKEISEE